MRINHNISAMVGHSSLYRVGVEMNKSLEKLSPALELTALQMTPQVWQFPKTFGHR